VSDVNQKEGVGYGAVEGLNNKQKTTKRRCYGILCTTTLFQRLYREYRHFA
jgi:transposase